MGFDAVNSLVEGSHPLTSCKVESGTLDRCQLFANRFEFSQVLAGVLLQTKLVSYGGVPFWLTDFGEANGLAKRSCFRVNGLVPETTTEILDFVQNDDSVEWTSSRMTTRRVDFVQNDDPRRAVGFP